MENKNKSPRLFFFLKFSISFSLLFYLFNRTQFSAIKDSLEQVSLPLVFVAISLLFLQCLAGSFRWCVVTKSIARSVPIWTSFKIILLGNFFNQFLPSSAGGDIMRVWYVRSIGLSTRMSIATILIDRLLALLALGALITITFPITYYLVDDSLFRLSIFGSGILIFILFFLIYYARKIPRKYYGYKITEYIRKFSDATHLILKERRTAILLLSLSMIMHLISGAVVYLIAISLGVKVGLLACLMLTQPVLLLTVIPVSIAGWGVREVGLIAVLSFVGVDNDNAFLVSIVFGILLIFISLPGAIVWVFKNQMLKRPKGENT